jgi:hypothetical protein
VVAALRSGLDLQDVTVVDVMEVGLALAEDHLGGPAGLAHAAARAPGPVGVVARQRVRGLEIIDAQAVFAGRAGLALDGDALGLEHELEQHAPIARDGGRTRLGEDGHEPLDGDELDADGRLRLELPRLELHRKIERRPFEALTLHLDAVHADARVEPREGGPRSELAAHPEHDLAGRLTARARQGSQADRGDRSREGGRERARSAVFHCGGVS